MIRRLFLLVFTLGLLFSLVTVVMGAGVLGETDLMFIPTTSTLYSNEVGFAINFQEGRISYFNCDFGLVKDLELGLAAFNYPNETRLSLRGKFRLLREHGDNPGLAIGLQDLGLDNVSPYIVLSKSFPEAGLKGYLGAGGGSFDGIFGGLDKIFYLERVAKNDGQLKQVDLYLEADSHGLNIGTKLGIGNQIKINFGLIDMDSWMLGASFLLK